MMAAVFIASLDYRDLALVDREVGQRRRFPFPSPPWAQKAPQCAERGIRREEEKELTHNSGIIHFRDPVEFLA